ncbi:peptidase S1, partial [Kitasatospora purpeofusca]
MKKSLTTAALAALTATTLATTANAVPGTVSGDGGNRIAVIKEDGSALVKEGPLYAPWTVEGDSVKQIVVAGNRIGILKGDGSALVKEGGLGAQWTVEGYDV